MARLRPRISINQSNLAGTIPAQAPTIMPAVRQVAGVAEQIASEAGEREALHKAAMAAQAFRFERDPQGNLVAPDVPVNDENMRVPSIFEVEYTNQLLRRYEKQVVIDAQTAFQKIAINSKLEPAKYEAAADAYIKTVVDNAPPHLKGKLNDELLGYSMSQLNYLYRQRAEWDNKRSLDVLDQAMKRDSELVGAEAGLQDAEGTELAIQKYLANYDEATGDLLVNGAKRDELELNIRRYAASNWLIGGVANTPNTQVDRRAMIEKLTRFSQGEGTIETVVGGKVVEVPVEELFPVPEVRQAIVQPSIQMLSSLSTASSQAEDARFDAANREWYSWYNKHWVDVVHKGVDPNYGRMQEFLDKAVRSGNSGLSSAIRVAMTQGQGTKELTRLERQTIDHLSRVFADVNNSIDKYLAELGDDATPEDVAFATREAFRKHAIDIPQTRESADFATELVYERFFLGEGNMPDLRTSDFRTEVLPVIDDWMSQVGIVPAEWSQDISAMIQSDDDRMFEKGWAIWKQMTKHPKLRRAMANGSALGAMNRALHFASEQTISEPSVIRKLIEDALFDPNWAPHGAWEDKKTEERELYTQAIEGIFEEGAFTSYWPGETEVQAINFKLSAPALSTMPSEMRQQIIEVLKYEAGQFSSQNKEAIGDYVIRAAERVMSTSGWRQTKIGYDPLRYGPGFAPGDDQPTYGWSLLPPEAFFPPDTHDDIYRIALEKARAYAKGEGYKQPLSLNNVALQYHEGSDYRMPGWRIMIMREDGNWEDVKTGNPNSEFRNFHIEHFEEVMPLSEARRIKALKLADNRKRKLRQFQRNQPGIPITYGHPIRWYDPETGKYSE